MSLPTRWVKDPKRKRDYKKQYFMKGKWKDVKPHYFTYNRLPYFAMSARARSVLPTGQYAYPYNNQPLYATLWVVARRLWEYIRDESGLSEVEQVKTYNEYIKALIKNDNTAELRAAWKEMTMEIVQMAINAFPIPEEAAEFKGLFNQFFMWFANKFYDFLFSL